MNLREAVSLFLAQQRASTRKSYHYVLSDMLDHIGPARPIEAVKVSDLILYMQDVRSRKHRGKPFASATIRKYVKTIRTLFNWLVTIGELESAPSAALKMPKHYPYITRDKAIQEHELQALLDVTRAKPRDHALILFLADTGCRAGGVCGLTYDDLDLENRRATVFEKGDKKRVVVFGDDCKVALERWLYHRQKKPGVHVFSRTRNAINPNNLGQIIRRNCDTANERYGYKIRRLSAHCFRHRKGHQLADDRIAPSIAATALGHASVQTTLNHYYPADWESAEKALRNTHVSQSSAPQDKVIILKQTGTSD